MRHRPDASIVIVTRNRWPELEKAIESSIAQEGDVEVIVIDDASTDGTSDRVRARFPGVRLVTSSTPEGYMGHRNRGVEMARAPIVVIIDDDAMFATPRVVAQTVLDFDHPRIAAVGVPFRDMTYQDTSVKQRSPDDHSIWILDRFKGTAQALRRDVFLALGGFRQSLVHQGEEGDLCIRALAAGYVVRCGRSDEIHHFESPKRDLSRQIRHNARNVLHFNWRYTPGPFHAVARTFASSLLLLRHGIRTRYVRATLKGLWWGVSEILTGRVARESLPSDLYALFRSLGSVPATSLSSIETRLPTIRSVDVGTSSDSWRETSTLADSQVEPKPFPRVPDRATNLGIETSRSSTTGAAR